MMSATVFGQARSLEGQPFELSSDLVNALHLRGLLAGCGVSLLIRGLMIDDYPVNKETKLVTLVRHVVRFTIVQLLNIIYGQSILSD